MNYCPKKANPNHVSITDNGNMLANRTADLINTNILWNSVLSTKGENVYWHKKNLYLATPMDHFQYMRMPMNMIPEGYFQYSPRMALCLPSYPICLCFWCFWSKLWQQRNVKHLINALKKEHKLSKDWTGSLCCDITLNWHHEGNWYLDTFIPHYAHKQPLGINMPNQQNLKTVPSNPPHKNMLQHHKNPNPLMILPFSWVTIRNLYSTLLAASPTMNKLSIQPYYTYSVTLQVHKFNQQGKQKKRLNNFSTTWQVISMQWFMFTPLSCYQISTQIYHASPLSVPIAEPEETIL